MVEKKFVSDYPELMKEWHPTKNGDLDPSRIRKSSAKSFWWKCKNEHEWEQSVVQRTHNPPNGKDNKQCSKCKTGLLGDCDYLVTEWHPTKNGIPFPFFERVSRKKYWWICSKHGDFEMSGSQRSLGRGCQKCGYERTSASRQQVKAGQSLFDVWPELAKQWHPIKNGDLKATDVGFSSGKICWWKCDNGHEWEASINYRAERKDKSCMTCKNGSERKLSFGEKFPNLLKEWCGERNEISPFEVLPGSRAEAWWTCRKENHPVWRAQISSRAKGFGACALCNNSGLTTEKLRHFIKYNILPNIGVLNEPSILNVLMEIEGLSNTNGKSKALIKGIQSGKFPEEELKKFANGESSIADGLLEAADKDDDSEEKIKTHSIGEPVEKSELEDVSIKSADEVLELADTIKVDLTDSYKKFVICRLKANLWIAALDNEQRAIREIESDKRGTEFVQELRKEFLAEYRACRKLRIPAGYTFEHEPNLMQLYIATQIRDEKRIGNFSTGGAGKTLSAVLASRVCKLKDRLTIILCVNNTIGEWEEKLKLYFSNSRVYTKTDDLEVKGHTYLLLNYEYLQQPSSERYVDNLLKYDIGMVVIDEIQQVKQRGDDISKRRRMTLRLLAKATEKDPDLRVLGMSGTPVINSLDEGKSLLEMIMGIHLDDLKTYASRSNAMQMYRVFAVTGFRWKIENAAPIIRKEFRADCTDRTEELLAAKGSISKWERILTEVRLPIILENIKKRGKTLVYTHYVTGIVGFLKEAIEAEGYRVAVFIGGDEEEKKRGFNEFVEGNANVLIASSCIGTGVDRLQHVCNRLIFNTLPWTNAERLQIEWRLARQGQTAKKVEVIYPVTYGFSAGKEWSYCGEKLKTLDYKRSLADACVDGIIPVEEMPSPAKIQKYFEDWLNRPEAIEERTVNRRKMKVALRRR